MEDLILARLEEISETKPVLFEGRGGLNLRFFFGTADLKNKNGRTYPLAVFAKGIAEAMARITAGASIFGSSDHMAQFGINDISHRITKLAMEDKNGVAEAAILRTDKGRNLEAIIRGKGSVGASMRGTGSTRDGIIQPDWRLEGIDFVLGPSFPTSVSSANVFESEQFVAAGDEQTLRRRWEQATRFAACRLTLEQFKEAFEKNINHEELDRLFRQALLSGFAGSYEDYRDKVYLRKK